MSSKGNIRFNTDTFRIEFARFYDKLNIYGDEDALNVTQEELDAAIEKGMTPSGKKMIPRDLAYVLKQRPKPEDCRPAVLKVKAESESRMIRLANMYGTTPGQLALSFNKGATPHNEVNKRDVHKMGKYLLKQQMNANRLFQLSDAALTHG